MTFDEHTNGQLRIGAQGDQIPLLALPDTQIPESDGPELASAQFRVWLESKQGSYWIPGTGTDEETVRKNLTRTQRARVRAIKQVTTREAT